MNIFFDPTLFYYEFSKKAAAKRHRSEQKMPKSISIPRSQPKRRARESKGINAFQRKHGVKE